MRGLLLGIVFCTALPGCGQLAVAPKAAMNNNPPQLIERREQLDAAVGTLVTIQGEVANSKIPTILGVDVVSDHPDLRGQQATATGILKKYTVTQEQLDRLAAEGRMIATRGPGTFYRLLVVGSQGEDVQVQPLPNKASQ